jgi:hypothetical protein
VASFWGGYDVRKCGTVWPATVHARSVFSYKCGPLAAEKDSLTVQRSGHRKSKSRGASRLLIDRPKGT